MAKDAWKISTLVTVTLGDKRTGKVKKQTEGPNIITDVGLNMLASYIKNDGVFGFPSYLAVGNDSTSPAAGQTALQGTELSRLAFDTESRTDNLITYKSRFDGSWSGTIEEAGLFNASSGGDMLARFLTGTFDKDTNDYLDITWKLTIQRP